MATRNNPYGAFNYTVKLGNVGGEDQVIGGFSDVSGLGNEVKYSEYRNGNEENHVRKIPNTNSCDDVTLKRGLIGDLRLFDWLKRVRRGAYEPKDVVISLYAENGATSRVVVCAWTLRAAQPKKWVGPTLAAKGGGEVAMEELQLVAESIEFESP